MSAPKKIEIDIVHLARVALSGRAQDVQVLLHRFAKGYKQIAPELAGALTDLLRESPTRSSPLRRQSEIALPVDVDTRFQLLRVEETPFLDHEPVFVPEVARELDRLVAERMKPQTLIDAGLQPTKSAIFTGPPGVGKTLAARWIARSLSRPLLILDLAAVMSSYLGRTGTNLRHVLDYAKSLDCVLLLDELDAIAKRRDDRSEIGELKRLVTVLIQQIDDWPPTGLLLAATNHAQLLDPAIWRRFEMVVEFPLPGSEAIQRFVGAALAGHTDRSEEWAAVLPFAFQGSSFSEIERALISARRSAAVRGENLNEQLTQLIKGDTLSKAQKIAVATALVEQDLTSQRKAHDLTGVARDTIRTHKAPSKSVSRKPRGGRRG